MNEFITTSDKKICFKRESYLAHVIGFSSHSSEYWVEVVLKGNDLRVLVCYKNKEEAQAAFEDISRQLAAKSGSENKEDKLKSYTLDEVKDEMIGEKGAPERDAYEKKLKVDVYISNLLDRVKHEFHDIIYKGGGRISFPASFYDPEGIASKILSGIVERIKGPMADELEEGGEYYLAPLKVSIERDSSDALTYEEAKTESLQWFKYFYNDQHSEKARIDDDLNRGE